jgi:hypothetical protein
VKTAVVFSIGCEGGGLLQGYLAASKTRQRQGLYIDETDVEATGCAETAAGTDVR